MQPANDPFQARSTPAGNRLETLLSSEATLVPFPAGAYRISIGGLEHAPKSVGSTMFPAVLVTVLPSSRQDARLDAGDGSSAWLQQTGEQARLTVAGQAGFVLFTTYRPSDYATTGIRLDIERLKDQQAAASPTGPVPGFAQPGQTEQPAQAAFTQPRQPGQPGFPQPGAPSLTLTPPSGSAFPGGQPFFGGQGLQFSPQPSAGMPAFGQTSPSGASGFPSQPRQAPQTPTPWMSPLGAPAAPGFGQPLSGPMAGPRPFTPPGQQQAYPQPSGQGAPAPGVRMAAHIEGEGDVAVEPGQQAGRTGSRRRIEAVALYAEGVNLHEIEYAAVTGDGRLMPWVCPPQFTGTRGLNSPLLGFAARLSGEAAARYDIVYSGSFFMSGPVGQQANGEFLKSGVQGDPLESLIVRLVPKG